MDKNSVCNMTDLRKRAGRFDVGKLVKLSGLSRALVYDLVSGKKKNPTLKTFQKLERAVRGMEAAGLPKEEKKARTEMAAEA